MMSGSSLTDGSTRNVIKVDCGELDALAARMAEKAKEVNSEIDAIGKELEGLCTRWVAPNRDRFAYYLFNAANFAVTGYGEYLTTYAQSLASAIKAYRQLEADINALAAAGGSR